MSDMQKVLANAKEVVTLSQRDADLRMAAMIQAYIDTHDSGSYVKAHADLRAMLDDAWAIAADDWAAKHGRGLDDRINKRLARGG